MNSVNDRLDAVGPLARVWNKVAGRVPRSSGPTIINVDISVPKVLEAERDELVGSVYRIPLGGGGALSYVLSSKGLGCSHTDLSPQTHPATPSHWWSEP